MAKASLSNNQRVYWPPSSTQQWQWNQWTAQASCAGRSHLSSREEYYLTQIHYTRNRWWGLVCQTCDWLSSYWKNSMSSNMKGKSNSCNNLTSPSIPCRVIWLLTLNVMYHYNHTVILLFHMFINIHCILIPSWTYTFQSLIKLNILLHHYIGSHNRTGSSLKILPSSCNCVISF